MKVVEEEKKHMTVDDVKSSQQAIDLEDKYGAHNYHPLPAVLKKGEGVYVWDVEDKKYFDFLSAYSAVNQGHCHPRIVDAMHKQSQNISLTSRAFHNNVLGVYEKYATEYFDFDKLLPMNSGAEAVETAIKISRKWAYEVKGIPETEAQIIVFENNFHGRTTTIISFSNDEGARKNFGPYTPGFIKVPYNDPEALEKVLKENKNIAGALIEPIQGEAGVFTPADDFIPQVKALCNEHNVLFMADEIQTGIARTGALLAVCGKCNCQGHCERQDTYSKPDVLILGKALSGGAYPVSAVLADDEVMNVIQPGQHGSTFGGNPVAAAVAMEALEVVRDEKLAQNARRLGELFRSELTKFIENHNIVTLVRGRGLLNAIVINDTEDSSTAWDICVALKENGLLAKPTHGNIIRFAPPLVITEEQIMECIHIITNTLKEFDK